MKICVNISLKDGVLDPQAKAIEKALHALNFSEVREVKMAKQIILELDTQDLSEAKAQAKKMCEELLVNSVIENYEFKNL